MNGELEALPFTERWRLHAKFDSLEDQEEIDPESAFPNDAVSKFIAFLSDHWSIDLPEELDEQIHWTPTEVVADCEIIDAFVDAYRWLLMYTSPKSITLTRSELSGG